MTPQHCGHGLRLWSYGGRWELECSSCRRQWWCWGLLLWLISICLLYFFSITTKHRWCQGSFRTSLSTSKHLPLWVPSIRALMGPQQGLWKRDGFPEWSCSGQWDMPQGTHGQDTEPLRSLWLLPAPSHPLLNQGGTLTHSFWLPWLFLVNYPICSLLVYNMCVSISHLQFKLKIGVAL